MADETPDTPIEETSTTEDTPPADDWKAPTRDEWERTQTALKKANDEAKNHRLKLKEAQKATEDADGKAAREATEAAERRYKPIAVRSSARAAFLEAGLADARPERVSKLMRMLDMDAIDIDDDGEVTGLDDQVATIKADYPELFAKAKTPVPRIDGSNRNAGNGQSPKTTGEKIAAMVLGNR